MEFDNTSRDVWEEMRAGTPFSPPPRDTGPYTEDFYGLAHEEYVDFNKLEDYIISSEKNATALFNYKSYVSNLGSYLQSAMNPPEKLILTGNTAFSFLNEDKKRIVVQFNTLLNKRIDYVSPSIGYSIIIDENTSRAEGTYNVYYANTNDKRISYDVTENPNDFTISDKYKAIILRTNNLEDFYQLYKHLNETLQAEHIRQEIVDELLKALNKTKSANTLAFLYSSIPDCALLDLSVLLDKTVLLEHLYLLKSSDENSWFSNTSGTLIRLLQLMCYSNTDFLVTICIKHPRLIKDLYFNMDAESTINGVTQTNKSLFANLLYALTIMHGSKEFNKIHHVYKIGKHYFQDSNVKASNDFFPNKIFLKQYKTWERPSTWFEDAINLYPLRYTTDEMPLTNGHYYDPMDLVMLIDMDSEDKTPVWVPAIFLKYLADEKEWKEIMFYLRIGADVLAIIMGVFTLGTSLYLIAALEIGVAAADILITIASDALMQTDLGRTFLETWNFIMITGGVALAPLLLINTAFRTGAALLRLAKNVATINFLRASLMKIILEVNIVNFTRGTMAIINTTEEIVKESRFLFKSSHITELQKAGVLFLKVEEKVSETVTRQGMAVFYEGQMIAIGDVKRVRELLKGVWGLKSIQLKQALDELYDLVIIEQKTLMHSDVGDFTLPANPIKSIEPGAMKSGGHGQSNIVKLLKLKRDFEILFQFKNGVRIGNVKFHKMLSKRTGTNQSWFPPNWDETLIHQAGKFVINNNFEKFKVIDDGIPIFDNFQGVRIGVMKTKGKPKTIFPDNSFQPMPKSKKIERNPFNK